MYEKIYNENGEAIQIIKPLEGKILVINEGTAAHDQYLLDIEEDPSCVIDNPPLEADILALEKAKEISKIDAETKAEISSCTFEYDSKTFSGSYSAKDIWTDYLLGVDTAVISLPLEKATFNDESYAITDVSQIKGALQAMFTVHYLIAQPKIQLKSDILACETLEELGLLLS